MADRTLTDITQADFDAAEAIVINLVRSAYPTLDLRRGTVLRDLLIRPAAANYAANKGNLQDIQQQMSLIALQENADTVDPDAVNAILSNFNVTRNPGQKSAGKVILRFDADRIYVISQGNKLQTLSGLGFVTTREYTVRRDAGGTDIPLQLSTDGTYYFCILDYMAEASGVQYDVAVGTAFDDTTGLFGFISAEAYSNFSGGIDDETIQQVIERLPVAISYRAFESRTSIDGRLHDYFDTTNIRINAISVQGFGDAAQLRDKHNPMGFAVGSRVDVYCRTFLTMPVVTLLKQGTLVSPGVYTVPLTVDESMGLYAVRSVSEPEAVVATTMPFGTLHVLGSYPFTETRQAQTQQTFHDIDPANAVVETAYTIYQRATINVTNVPSSDTLRQFKVELYRAPGIQDIQNFFDLFYHRNVEADYIVRCPVVCFVGITGKLYYDARYPVDITALNQLITDYVNSRNFTRYLTRSELVKLLLNNGIERVDLADDGLTIQGLLRDASGTMCTLSGDTLDIDTVNDPANLVTRQTVVFATDSSHLHFELVAE